MNEVKEAFDRVNILQHMATEYDKKVVRFYSHVTNNWNRVKWREILRDLDIYEMVESYYKVLRKHGLTTNEEPYYFLSPDKKRKVKYAGDMAKRSTQIDDSEIQVSILEGFE